MSDEPTGKSPEAPHAPTPALSPMAARLIARFDELMNQPLEQREARRQRMLLDLKPLPPGERLILRPKRQVPPE